MLQGLRAVKLSFHADYQGGQNLLSDPRMVAAITKDLQSYGVAVVQTDAVPILYLSVDTTDLGGGLAFAVRLHLFEPVVLPRTGGNLVTPASVWENSQLGNARYDEVQSYLVKGIATAVKRFGGGVKSPKDSAAGNAYPEPQQTFQDRMKQIEEDVDRTTREGMKAGYDEVNRMKQRMDEIMRNSMPKPSPK